MPFLLIVLILFFFIPWLAILFLVFSLLALLVLIPLGFVGTSVFWLFAGGGQFFKILFNKRLRRNHALEHATVNVIEESLGRKTRITGMAHENGFSLRGIVDPISTLNAARTALARLQAGERDLAVHPRCGSTLVAVNTLASLLFLLLLGITGRLSILNVVLALLLAHVSGPFISRPVQRYVTTSQDVKGMEITGVEVLPHPVGRFGLPLLISDQIFIHTRQSDEPVPVEVVVP